jgi:hypothetical protein
MPDRSRKRPGDLNALAKSIVDDATSGEPRHKKPAAVELGRMGARRTICGRSKNSADFSNQTDPVPNCERVV